LIASAQDGKNSIIRIWDYFTARCITMMTMPVKTLQCITFSHDGRYIACSGKTAYMREASKDIGMQLCNKELICIWDISRIQRGEKPELIAKQTSDYGILCLKFSPIDVTRLALCGKENIRFWKIRDTQNYVQQLLFSTITPGTLFSPPLTLSMASSPQTKMRMKP